MGKSTKPKRYPAEVRERAIRMVATIRPEHPSEWAAIQSVAHKLGCTSETLRAWIRKSNEASPNALDDNERERLKLLEREVRELRRANEILKKASAYFAQAELDRPLKK